MFKISIKRIQWMHHFQYFCKLKQHTTMQQDNLIFDLIEEEKERQLNGLELIASENFVSDQVMRAQGSVLTNKYAEGISRKTLLWGL